MTGIRVDGRLVRGEEIAELGRDALLVGNGLSINVSPDFAYDSLFGEAEKTRAEGGLDDLDRVLFERFETSNFEVVLGKLRDAVAIAEELDFDAEPYRERFASVQGALGNATTCPTSTTPSRIARRRCLYSAIPWASRIGTFLTRSMP